MKRSEILELIESLMLKLITCVVSGNPLVLSIRDQKHWGNTIFTDRVKLKPLPLATMIQVNFTRKCSQQKFSNLMHILAKVYKLLATNSTCTLRELYYQDVQILKSQCFVDSAVRSISCMLDVSPWDLGVINTSKGLIAGPLVITMDNDDVVDCNRNQGGVLVPQNIVCVKSIKSTAKFILLVEKDAIFQKLLDEGFLISFNRCILITGKGYPDTNTRFLINRLVTKLSIPILALVDPDPHGIEIMCVYRYGSLAMAHQADLLATPDVRWLGVHPSEINLYNPPTMPLTKHDYQKIDDLIARPYVQANVKLRQELDTLRSDGKKGEIEGISGISSGYLTGAYLPQKIKSKDFF